MMEEIKFVIALTLLLFSPSVYGDDNEALLACEKLMEPVYADEMCCNNLETLDKVVDKFQDCQFKGSSKELVCSDYECFLNKQGMFKDGKIIEEKARLFLDEIAKENPQEKNIVESLKEECLDGQYEEYPPDEDCSALKFYACIYTNVVVGCESWKDTKICKEASDLAKKCKEAK